MKEKKIMFVIFITCVSLAFLYFWKFNGAFSNNAEDWAGFGSYIGGVATPILTIFNIWVFIKLTNAVNKNDERRRIEELKYQKKLILIQLRQNEFNHFSTVVNNILVLKSGKLNAEILEPIMSCLVYLEGILNSKSHILPIMNEPSFQEKLINFRNLVAQYSDCISESFNPAKLSNNCSEDVVSSNLLVDLMKSRSGIISELQSFILSDVEE